MCWLLLPPSGLLCPLLLWILELDPTMHILHGVQLSESPAAPCDVQRNLMCRACYSPALLMLQPLQSCCSCSQTLLMRAKLL
jgi:hypothetical protein